MEQSCSVAAALACLAASSECQPQRSGGAWAPTLPLRCPNCPLPLLLRSPTLLSPPLPLPPARLEAMIDFGEDEGIADDVAAGVLPQVAALRQQLERHLASAVGGELVRCGAPSSTVL